MLSLAPVTGAWPRWDLAVWSARSAYPTTVPKIKGRSLKEHREWTRTRVFDALVSLLSARSFDSISIADIAAEAGIGRTAIYNHFRDKEAVVVAFASDETSRYLERLDLAMADAHTATERLGVYVRNHVATSQEFHFGLGPELYGMLSREAMLELREHVVAVEQVLRDILAQGMASGEFQVADSSETIRLIHACLQPRGVDSAAVEAFVLRGVGAPTP